MILEALVRHYDHLAGNLDSGIATFGYSRQKIGFYITLDVDGRLHAIQPLIDESSGKPRPTEMVVPGQAKPSGSGINPCFLWDNPAYLLGYTPADAEAKAVKRAAKSFAGFRDRHLALEKQIADETFSTVCRFLEAWDPSTLAARNDTEPLNHPGFGVFEVRNANQYAHQCPTIQAYWQQQLQTGTGDDAFTSPGTCLITGEYGPIARLHEPKIKGVTGAQSAGATLVSFNEKAYESHGKDQGYNAPVSEAAAFKYATALNHLLADREHRVQLGDTTCVFWADRPETGAAEALADMTGSGDWMSNTTSTADRAVQAGQALSDFLNRFRQAKADPAAGKLEDADAPFYVLGLAPNAARLSVRFWMSCTVSELAERLGEHIDRTRIFDSRQQVVAQPTLRALLRETGRESKDIPPQLAGELARCVLLGLKLPHAFALAILRRIKADQANNLHPAVNPARAAGLKAWLIRNYEMEVPVALDPDRTDTPYLLGRLFAAYEKIQQDSAESKLNRTIRDSYLSSASATPASIFPRLYRLNQHHFNKLRRGNPGLAVVREKLIGAICNPLTDFPRQLALQDQGLFAIGYYHQIQDFYTKRESAEPETANSTAASGD